MDLSNQAAPPQDAGPSADPSASPAADQGKQTAVSGVSMDLRSGLYQRSPSRRGRRHGSGSRETRLKKQLLATRLFAAATLAIIVVLSIMFIRAKSELDNFNAESGALASELNRAQGELQQAKQLVTAQEVELGALIKQRIPGVDALELDRLYDVNQQYFKKLSFSHSGVGEGRQLSYYAVLKNTESTPLKPSASILLFDRKGLQTGMARISKDAATTEVKTEGLAPGETRTYSARIDSQRPDEPRYFMVQIR